MPEKYKFLLWGFEDATKLPRPYLLLDMRLETDDKLCVRARINKNHEWKKVTYSLICVFVFFVCTKKQKTENKEMKSLYNLMY